MSDHDTEKFLVGSGLAKLFGGPVPHKVFDFDGCGERFKGHRWAVRAPSAADQQQAIADAKKYLEGLGWRVDELQLGELGGQAIELASKAFILARALVRPEAPETLFAKDGKEVLHFLQPDEIAVLFDSLVEYQQERSPLSSGALTPARIDEVLDDLGKGLLPVTWWRSFGSATLARFTQRAADRLALQTSPRSSPSISPPSSGSDGSDGTDSSPSGSP